MTAFLRVIASLLVEQATTRLADLGSGLGTQIEGAPDSDTPTHHAFFDHKASWVNLLC